MLLSVDVAEIERLVAAGEWSRAGELLADDARAVERAGADPLLLCTNTMHTVADAIGRRDVPVPTFPTAALHVAAALRAALAQGPGGLLPTIGR